MTPKENELTLKEIVENNVVIWLLGCLLTGFLAGLAAWKYGQDIFGQEQISKSYRLQLEKRPEKCETCTNTCPDVKSTVCPNTGPLVNIPNLSGVEIHLSLPDVLDARDAEIKSKLKKAGNTPILFRTGTTDPGDLNIVVYYNSSYLDYALETAAYLRSSGIAGPKLVQSANPDYLIKATGPRYLDIRLAP